MRFRATLMLGALLVVAAAGSAFGQGFQGGLRGSIKDAGGVIPGVEVTLNNEQTNIKRSTVTNERGEYVFANVDPGNYAVKASLIETGNASTGTVLDSQALATLPAPGRAAFMMGASVPTVIASGDTQFNRQQD